MVWPNDYIDYNPLLKPLLPVPVWIGLVYMHYMIIIILMGTNQSIHQLTIVSRDPVKWYNSDKRYPALIKLAYVGEPSRPVFPLSPKFLEISNNSWVAYNKRTKLLQVCWSC